MKEINNLIYSLEINYKNNSGTDCSIFVKFSDAGLKIKTARVGNICITEETINGRVLGGRFDSPDYYCGYRYDYQNGENLLNINPTIPIDTATSLISKTKMKSDFLSAELVLSSIARNDYRVVTLNKGNLNIIKTISAENKKCENFSLQENIDLVKLDGEESFVEQNKKIIYKINDKCIVEEKQSLANNDIKLQFNELSYIIDENPQSYKELIGLKNKIQKKLMNNLSNVDKAL